MCMGTDAGRLRRCGGRSTWALSKAVAESLGSEMRKEGMKRVGMIGGETMNGSGKFHRIAG